MFCPAAAKRQKRVDLEHCGLRRLSDRRLTDPLCAHLNRLKPMIGRNDATKRFAFAARAVGMSALGRFAEGATQVAGCKERTQAQDFTCSFQRDRGGGRHIGGKIAATWSMAG